MTEADPRPSLFKWPMLGVWLALAVYILAFAVSYPPVLTVSDEAAYMRQASAFSHGQRTVTAFDAVTGESVALLPSDYPAGTSLAMTPLMALGGWRAGFLLGAACCVMATLLLAALLTRRGLSPLFALLFLAYPPTLVISRCGMSDLPTTALVAAGLYCFFRGETAPWRLAAGFFAGLTLLFRETAPLLFTPLFIGVVIRRERGQAALILGGLCGVALRLLAAWLIFDDVFYIKQTYPGFSLSALPANAPIYALALLVFVPGGFGLAALYRGARRAEFLVTLVTFTLLHLLFEYNATASGTLKQLVLGPRLFIPMLPLLILALAESTTRLWREQLARATAGAKKTLTHATRMGCAILALGVSVEAAAVSFAHGQWQLRQRAIVVGLYAATERGVPTATNFDATRKFANELYDTEFGERTFFDFAELTDGIAHKLLARHDRITIALVVRRDSSDWSEKGNRNSQIVRDLGRDFQVEPAGSTEFPTGERLEVYTLRARH